MLNPHVKPKWKIPKNLEKICETFKQHQPPPASFGSVGCNLHQTCISATSYRQLPTPMHISTTSYRQLHTPIHISTNPTYSKPISSLLPHHTNPPTPYSHTTQAPTSLHPHPKLLLPTALQPAHLTKTSTTSVFWGLNICFLFVYSPFLYIVIRKYACIPFVVCI